MNIFLRFSVLVCIAGFWGMDFLHAQTGIHTPFLDQQIHAQLYQPAWLATDSFKRVQVGFEAGYDLTSNVLAIGDLPFGDTFLDESEKNALISKLEEDNRLRISTAWGVHANVRLKKSLLSFGYRQRTLNYFRTNNPNTVGLLLRGNAAYQGQVISDQDMTILSQDFTEFSIGTALGNKKIQLGVRAKLLLGSRVNMLEDTRYSLETAEYGTQINFQSTYNWSRNTNAQSGTPGMGLAVDLGVRVPINPKWDVQLAVIDLGYISWNGVKLNNQVDIDYNGRFIDALGDLDFSNTQDFFQADTLETLIFPDSTEGDFQTQLGGWTQLGTSFKLSSNAQLFVSARLGLDQFSSGAPAPLVNVGYQHILAQSLTLGVNAYGGGMDQIGFGAMAAYRLLLGKGHRIHLFYQLDRAMGLALTDMGKGVAMQAGASWAW